MCEAARPGLTGNRHKRHIRHRSTQEVGDKDVRFISGVRPGGLDDGIEHGIEPWTDLPVFSRLQQVDQS